MGRPWMPLYVADYLADTAHLGATESGAYLHLIMHYWQTGNLPTDDRTLARIAKIDPRQWHRYKPVLSAFFVIGNGGQWSHTRIDKELLRSEEISNKRKSAALQMHSNRAANAPAHAEQVQTQLQPQSQTEEESKKEDSSLRSAREVSRETNSDDWPKDFREQFWNRYPRKAGKKAAITKLEGVRKRGEVPFGVLMAGIAKIPISEPRFIPHPATWLNEGRWDDEVLPLGASNGSSRRLQDDSLSVSRALRQQREDGGFAVPPRPSLLPTPSGSDLRLLPERRGS